MQLSMLKVDSRWDIALYLVYAVCIAYLLHFSRQDGWTGYILPWMGSFLAFFLILQRKNNCDYPQLFIGLIGLIKITSLFSIPMLSNDFYRFWWDGWLSSHGINPFDYTPSEALSTLPNATWKEPMKHYFPFLNSAEYHTVYPILSQGLFAICAKLSDGNLWLFSLIMKGFYLFGDVMCFKGLNSLLKDRKLSPGYGLLYFGNPLIIVEFFGNLHTEFFMICFFIWAIRYYNKPPGIASFGYMVFSILSKLNSLLWLPFFIYFRQASRKWVYFSCALLLTLALMYLPAIHQPEGFLSSIRLYFEQFEFNSLIYVYLRDFLFQAKWYEWQQRLGWILLLVFLIFYLKFWIPVTLRKTGTEGFPFASSWWIYIIYIGLSSTVHPWYISPLILLGIFYNPWSSMILGMMISFSYSYYDPIFQPYSKYYMLIAYMISLVCVVIENRKLVKLPPIIQSSHNN